MDVEWNEARMDEGVTDGHSHNSFRSDTHEEIREVEIEYSWRNYGNNGAASIPAIQRSTKDTGRTAAQKDDRPCHLRHGPTEVPKDMFPTCCMKIWEI